MPQGTIKKSAKPTSSSHKAKKDAYKASDAPKRGVRVVKAPKSSKAVKNHVNTAKMMKKFSAGVGAKTEAMLGERAGHLELIGPGKKKGADRKTDKAHQAGSRRFG
ncbi:kinetochore protein [Ophiostoma piceae UAMH 11346]|uniref:Kinetochore protein n=1 Tax=Ophiostoma piceae (strain UAMH 11346) TaxID=1262450 RepID=S3CNM9_OPHP1|nr:kinetochore protein [Ophiostoma piceae UAMH 11346]